MESDFSSAGTLHKFWRLVEAQGLKREVVWGNILKIFAYTHAGAQPWMIHNKLAVCPSRRLGPEALCSQEFVPFFADVGIDENGEVLLFETHPACNFKPCHSSLGLEMEGCYHPVVTEYGTRKATWGSTSMGFSRYIDPEFQIIAKQWISSNIMSGSTRFVLCALANQTITDGCISTQAVDILIQMAHEDYISCKLGLDDAMYVLKGAATDTVQLNESDFMDKLELLLDDRTLKFYEVYKELELWHVSKHFSAKHCNSDEDVYSFGTGQDQGCTQ
mmetsp:Transcript_14495/g.27276  ORF Transcript_14495/g.27276 Transcript_14495/m.27276 type:complete len:275 (+) Transcript_14495:967-1791(+)